MSVSTRALLPLAALLLCANPALSDPAPHLLSVTGTAEVKAAPDQAMLSSGVVAQAATAAEALSANAKAMNQVFATLKRAGIAEKNIQTSNFSVNPQYSNPKPGQNAAPHIVGYQVTNTVNVTVDKLANVGPTLDALVAAGSNQIDGPSFSIADPKPLLAQARAAAVQDATDRAKAYAAAAGVTLGPIVSIGEGGEAEPRPVGRMFAMAKAAPSPIAAGEESVTATVSISWEIH